MKIKKKTKKKLKKKHRNNEKSKNLICEKLALKALRKSIEKKLVIIK